MINKASLRHELAAQMIPYMHNPEAKPLSTFSDFSINEKDSIAYATYSLQSINNKYNLYLAYFYSNSHSTPSAFYLLHQRMSVAWPYRIKFDENIAR